MLARAKPMTLFRRVIFMLVKENGVTSAPHFARYGLTSEPTSYILNKLSRNSQEHKCQS